MDYSVDEWRIEVLGETVYVENTETGEAFDLPYEDGSKLCEISDRLYNLLTNFTKLFREHQNSKSGSCCQSPSIQVLRKLSLPSS